MQSSLHGHDHTTLQESCKSAFMRVLVYGHASLMLSFLNMSWCLYSHGIEAMLFSARIRAIALLLRFR